MLLYEDLRKEYECINNKRCISLKIVQEKEEGWTEDIEVELMRLFLADKSLQDISCSFQKKYTLYKQLGNYERLVEHFEKYMHRYMVQLQKG